MLHTPIMLDTSKYTRYDITPVPKPRQTRADRWKQRPPVMRYRAFADEVRLKGVEVGECGYHVVFQMPMPKSWAKAKKERMNGQPHQQKPDKDNLEKALLDAIYADDSLVWDGRVTKTWGYDGAILVMSNEPERN